MAQQIQVRRDSAADWTSAAPTLADGEIGFETDTGKFKIGNGTDAWGDLDYFDPNAGGAVDSVNAQTGVVVLDADDIDDSATTRRFATAAQLSKLDGVEAGATADQSAAEILTAIKTVDGTGSGLDADTVDGSEASALLDRANHTGTQAQSTVTNLVSDLAAKAPLASPALTGNPTAPTQSANDNSTKIATTAYVDSASGTSGGLVPIAETILGSAAATITFDSIPQDYSHLQLVFSGRSTGAGRNDIVLVRFNSDTGNNYDWIVDYGANVTAAAAPGSGVSSIRGFYTPAASSPAGNSGGGSIDVLAYKGTTLYKATCGKWGQIGNTSSADSYVVTGQGQWRNTAAITRIDLTLNSAGNFVAGTHATLYGVAPLA